MAADFTHRSDFASNFIVHAALRLALKHKLFGKEARFRRTAERLVAELESDRTIYGRQLKMLAMMESGASIDAMCRKLRCSRRTIFRYLNHLEQAKLDITLDGHEYYVSGDLLDTLAK